MSIKKGDQFYATYSKQTYQIAGKWGGNWVLAPMDQDNNECLIYMAEEIEEMVNRRQWLQEAGCTK